jgi:hypothetical protein
VNWSRVREEENQWKARVYRNQEGRYAYVHGMATHWNRIGDGVLCNSKLSEAEKYNVVTAVNGDGDKVGRHDTLETAVNELEQYIAETGGVQ